MKEEHCGERHPHRKHVWYEPSDSGKAFQVQKQCPGTSSDCGDKF